MSDSADQLRAAADGLGDTRDVIEEADFDVGWETPDEAPTPEAIVEKIDGQLGELQVALQELAANVDVIEDLDDE